ncbi:collagen alpha-2(VIII) chain-like [Antechinus flavipes]|uniref:collagen alpha-2(VIII) chain-like n=1 Tax=Antechinus flavipes TaxID=38775 RepID=UPI002235526C|nr:collagen alpha-2(VIII) chain-like [Antechinus flavipes]
MAEQGKGRGGERRRLRIPDGRLAACRPEGATELPCFSSGGWSKWEHSQGVTSPASRWLGSRVCFLADRPLQPERERKDMGPGRGAEGRAAASARKQVQAGKAGAPASPGSGRLAQALALLSPWLALSQRRWSPARPGLLPDVFQILPPPSPRPDSAEAGRRAPPPLRLKKGHILPRTSWVTGEEAPDPPPAPPRDGGSRDERVKSSEAALGIVGQSGVQLESSSLSRQKHSQGEKDGFSRKQLEPLRGAGPGGRPGLLGPPRPLEHIYIDRKGLFLHANIGLATDSCVGGREAQPNPAQTPRGRPGSSRARHPGERNLHGEGPSPFLGGRKKVGTLLLEKRRLRGDARASSRCPRAVPQTGQRGLWTQSIKTKENCQQVGQQSRSGQRGPWLWLWPWVRKTLSEVRKRGSLGKKRTRQPQDYAMIDPDGRGSCQQPGDSASSDGLVMGTAACTRRGLWEPSVDHNRYFPFFFPFLI